MMRKMLRTIGSAAASVLSNLSMVVPSVPFHRSVNAPRSRTRGRQIETGKAVENCQRTAVDQWKNVLRRVKDEIGERHLAGQDKSRRTREQAEDQQRAADQLDKAGSAEKRERLDIGVGR